MNVQRQSMHHPATRTRNTEEKKERKKKRNERAVLPSGDERKEERWVCHWLGKLT